MLGITQMELQKSLEDNFDAKYAMSLTRYNAGCDKDRAFNMYIDEVKSSIKLKSQAHQYHLAYSINRGNAQFETQLIKYFKQKGYSVIPLDNAQGITGRCILLSWDIDF